MEKEREKVWIPVSETRTESKDGHNKNNTNKEANIVSWSSGEIVSDGPREDGTVVVMLERTGEEISVALDQVKQQNVVS